jgi:hypothetical protein
VWPDTEPRDLYGPAVVEPDELILMDWSGDRIGGREAPEETYVERYEKYGAMTFSSEHVKNRGVTTRA